MRWWQNAVVYQVYPRSFQDSDGDGIGDLRGITQRLPYLAKLGVDAVWLSPIFKSPNDDNGYDISDYEDIMDEFGTMADFDKLNETAHDLGLKIILDLVANHSSDEHVWFVESSKSKDNPYSDYYLWHPGQVDESGQRTPPNNWGSVFGGHAWEFSEERGEYYFHFFSKKQPDLNWRNPKVREELFSMMRFWCDKGVDGFRMDVIDFIGKPDEALVEPFDATAPYSWPDWGNSPRVHEYLREMNTEVLAKYDLLTVGEVGGVVPEDAFKYSPLDESEISMIFNFQHLELDQNSPDAFGRVPAKLSDMKKIFSLWQTELHNKAWYALVWSNHDQPRPVSRFGSEDPQYREKSAKMLAHLMHFHQGTPYVYQGEELGAMNYKWKSPDEYVDIEGVNAMREAPKLGTATREQVWERLKWRGRDNGRTPMQWSDSKNGGFSDSDTTWIPVNPDYSFINAEEQVERPDSVFNYYRELIRLRHEEPLITTGSYEILDPASDETYSYLRKTDRHAVLAGGEGADAAPSVAGGSVENAGSDNAAAKDETLFVSVNYTDKPQVVEVPASLTGKDGELWLTNDDSFAGLQSLPAKLELPPYAAIAFCIR